MIFFIIIVPGIFVTPPTTSVVEGGSVQVCVGSNVTSLRPIDVTLSTINGTATGKLKSLHVFHNILKSNSHNV